MSLRRHEIARELLAEASGTGESVEVARNVAEVSTRFGVTYSTMAVHVRELEADGVVVSTKPVVLNPSALPAIGENRTRLRLVTSEPDSVSAHPPVESPQHDPVDALVRLGEVAIAHNNLDALALIVEALHTPADDSRLTHQNRDQNRDTNRENRDFNRDFARHGSKKEEERSEKPSLLSPSLHRDQIAKTATPNRETSTPPPSGDKETDKVLAEMLQRSPLSADADATPQWIRSGALDATTWTEQDAKMVAAVWQTAVGRPLGRPLKALLRIWTPTEAADAIRAVAADQNVRSPGGQLATAATLGYHRYFPLNPQPPLPHWDLWCTTRTAAPHDLPGIRQSLESLSGLAGTPEHLIRVAATLAAHPQHIPTATTWDFIHLDADTVTDTIARYEKATP